MINRQFGGTGGGIPPSCGPRTAKKVPKRIAPLSSTKVASAKPRDTANLIRDGLGLCLKVTPTGGKLWRLDYRRPGSGQRNQLGLGAYPAISLSRAREQRDEARRLLADGIDPGEHRKAAAAAGVDTFEAVAREWYATRKAGWVDAHGDRIIRRLERDVFPWTGKQPVGDVTAPAVLAVFRRIESRGVEETAHRALSNIGQVIRYAIATGRATADPTFEMSEALAPVAERHLAAVLDPDQLGDLLRAIDAYSGTLPVRCALRLAPLVFLRPSELRNAEWVEFDLDAAVWDIPAHRRKLKKSHQLDHRVLDPNGRAYNRTSFLPERREMMQAWADYLDRLREAK